MTEASTISGGVDTSEGRADRRMLIDGRLVEAPGTFPSINPATEEVVGHAPDATVADAEAAVAAARRAFDTTDWSTNTDLRIRCLEQLHRALDRPSRRARRLNIAEVGATPAMCAGAQLDAPIAIVRYYADLLKTYPLTEDLGNTESHGMQHHRWVEKEAAGVVAAIIAYNYPTQLALAKLAPALAAGLHRRAEGRAGHTVDHPCARRADRQPHRHSRRRGQRALRRRPSGRCRTDDQPRRRHGDLHRLDPDRAGDHGRGERDMQTRLPRVGRQVRGDPARRRRLRHRGAVLLIRHREPLGPGLCDHDADAGARASTTTRSSSGSRTTSAWSSTATRAILTPIWVR